MSRHSGPPSQRFARRSAFLDGHPACQVGKGIRAADWAPAFTVNPEPSPPPTDEGKSAKKKLAGTRRKQAPRKREKR